MLKHIGFTEIQASKGLLDMDKLIEHFMKVNGVDIKIFEDHRNQSFDQWRKRSTHQWETELSKWAELVNLH